jgi:lipopolysaccharide export system permease protein
MKFFILSVPFVVDQLGPILILLSGVISLGILNHTRELIALKAGGIPLRKIVRPFLIGGLVFTSLLFAAAQWLLPYTIATTNGIWHEQVKGKLPLGIYRNGRYYYKGVEGFYSFEWPNPKKLIFRSFSYSRWNENYNTEALITAKYAKWSDGKQRWILDVAQVQKMEEEGKYVIHNFPHWEIELPENPIDFLVPEYEIAEQSLTELYRSTKTQETPGQTRKAWSEFLSRISYILLGLPLLILGLPILLISYRKWGRDLSIAIPASCGLAFIAWGAWGALQSLASAGYLPPLIASTAVHVIFAGAGFLLLRRQDM